MAQPQIGKVCHKAVSLIANAIATQIERLDFVFFGLNALESIQEILAQIEVDQVWQEV